VVRFTKLLTSLLVLPGKGLVNGVIGNSLTAWRRALSQCPRRLAARRNRKPTGETKPKSWSLGRG